MGLKTLNCFSNYLCFSSEILPSFLRVIEEIVPVRPEGEGGGTLLSSISAAPKGMGREKFLARERYRF